MKSLQISKLKNYSKDSVSLLDPAPLLYSNRPTVFKVRRVFFWFSSCFVCMLFMIETEVHTAYYEKSKSNNKD